MPLSRRTFLKSSAAVSAASVVGSLPAPPPRHPTPSPSPQFTICLGHSTCTALRPTCALSSPSRN
ncbi:twin-arginine translocation signal domain-containing protein [Bradyrhizobium sp. BR 1432]|uniref:twin-arginine translocation signal domain-containing protein n=1 Tax=Bradyrhizobium sp. BR 1432 TaxID=3447966 RepID=UPI003EE4974D